MYITCWPECYKEDVESQRKNLKFDLRHLKTPELIGTKIGRGDYIWDTYTCAKLHYDAIREFCPRICEVAYQMFTRLVFWVFPPRPLCRFYRSLRHFACTRMCLLGVPKTKSYILSQYCLKMEIFGQLLMEQKIWVQNRL